MDWKIAAAYQCLLLLPLCGLFCFGSVFCVVVLGAHRLAEEGETIALL